MNEGGINEGLDFCTVCCTVIQVANDRKIVKGGDLVVMVIVAWSE